MALFEAALHGPIPPLAVMALTLKVYAVLQVRPVITTGDADPVAVTLPGVDVTV